MTDELTPEEKEAFDNLPRERMPVGLEARVVEAMRDHGFIAKRRRAIEITNRRVAGVLAASVALMIGAYSIGLHRGDGSQVPLLPETVTRAVRAPVQEPAFDPRGKKDEGLVSRTNLEAEQATPERVRETSPPASDEPRGTAGAEGRLAPESKPEKSSLKEAAAPSAASSESVAATQALRATVPPSVTKHPLTFLLNGSPVTVDADSTRVVQDGQGRVLLIFTSDGIIRIPLAD